MSDEIATATPKGRVSREILCRVWMRVRRSRADKQFFKCASCESIIQVKTKQETKLNKSRILEAIYF